MTASGADDHPTDDDGDLLVCSPGEVYGGYEIVRLLAAGGTCQIFEARHAIMQRRVAIKVQKVHLRANAKRSHRIASEAMALAAIDHPNVVRIYHADVDERVGLYIVMELLEGRDVRRVIDDLAKSGRRLALKVAAALTVEIADGIAAFHRVGIIHRDLKPDNIFLQERGPGDVVVKLLDLGIAKLPKGLTKTTDKHIAVGTLPYMAPEQLLEGAVSVQSDVYALALVFDEMLSGVHAFSPGRGIINPAMRDTVIRTRIIEGLYDPLDVRLPGFPKSVSSFVARCLSRDPHQRPSTMHAFSSELRDLVRSAEAMKSDEHPIGTGPRHGVTPPQPIVGTAPAPVPQPAAPVQRNVVAPQRPRIATVPMRSEPKATPKPVQVGGTERMLETPRAPVAVTLPPFAVPLSTRLDCPSFVLVAAPGAWRFLRIPIRMKPEITMISRASAHLGEGSEIPLPGLKHVQLLLDSDDELRLVTFGEPLVGHDAKRALKPYGAFTIGAYTFMLVPPTPDGLGIPPDYETLMVPKNAELPAPALLVKSGHRAALDRMFPIAGATVRVGGLVDLEAPLFRLSIPHAVTLRWDPGVEAFRVTLDLADGRVRVTGAGAAHRHLVPYGSIHVDGWELVLVPTRPRRRP